MNKVYIVTSGEYSDYSINKVFSTRKLAEEWCGPFLDKEFSIEEHDLDSMIDQPIANSSELYMNLNTGEVMSYNPNVSTADMTKDYYSKLHVFKGYKNQDNLRIKFPFYDLERATKIAGEKRAKILYNREFLGLTWGDIYVDRDTCLPVTGNRK